MPAITIQDLNNAKTDVDHIAAIATSTALTATDRLGHTKLTVLGAVTTLAAFNPRGTRVNGAVYALKDIYTESGIAYVVVVPSFTSVSVAADTTAGNVAVYQRPANVTSARDYGAALNGTTDDSAALVAANAAAAGGPLLIDGIAKIVSATTITSPLVDTLKQIFTADSQVTIDNGGRVRPEWFGWSDGNIQRAVDSLPYPKGGKVVILNKVYPRSYYTAQAPMFDNRGGVPGVDYMVKPNIEIVGEKLPKFSDDNSGLKDGSIITGPFYVTSEATGFSIDKVGVDSGANVIAALYSGSTTVDAFCYLQVNKSAPIYGKGCTVGDIVGIGGGPANQCHAILIEAMDGATIGNVEGRQAFHGVVVKSKNIVGGHAVGKGSNGECVIFKSDDYAQLRNVKFDSVTGIGLNPGEPGYGFLIQAAGDYGQSVQVGAVYAESKALAMASMGNGTSHALVDVQIGNVLSQSCGAGYCVLGGADRVQAGNVVVNNSTDAVYVDQFTAGKANSIANLAVTVAVNGLNIYGKISVGAVAFDQISGKAVLHSTPQARIRISSRVNSNIGFSNDWNLQPALAGTWVNQGGGGPFSLTLDHGKVVMSGLIGGGSDTLVIVALDPRIRPPVNLGFNCIGYNGTVRAAVEVLVTTTGEVYATPLSATSNNLSLQGVSWDVPF